MGCAEGPSTDPRERRLAIRTEDHPSSYADFVGTIPDDEDGGGSVIVWEQGHWTNTTHDDDGAKLEVDDALLRGHLSFDVDGHKLNGGFTLQRLDDHGQWLLIKHRDHGADARRDPTSTEPESVISGYTVDEVGAHGRDS